MSTTTPGFVVTRLSVMMFLQFFVWGAWFATMGGCLADHKLASIIGAAYGSQPIAAIIAPLFLGLIADRFFSSERVLGVLHLLGAAFLLMIPGKIADFAGLPPAEQAAAGLSIVTLFNLHMICYMPTIGLTNSIAFSHIKDQDKFPRIRVLGTIGWIVAGWILASMGASTKTTIFFLAGGAGIAMGLFSFFLPHTPPPSKGKPVNLAALFMVDAFKLLGKPSFLIFIICSTLVCIPLAYYYAFASVYLPEVGFQKENISFLMTFGQISEIFFMLLIPFFFRRLGVKWMLAVGIICWVLRYALFAASAPDHVKWMAMIAVILHGICYDFFFVTGYMYTDQVASPQIRNQAQSLVVFFTLGVGMFFGFGLAGAKFGQIFPDPNAPPPGPPVGLIGHLQDGLGSVVKVFGSLIDSLSSGLISSIKNPWQQFWILPCLIASVVLVVFLASFWDKEKKPGGKSSS
jgi:nucleoside transporter